VYTTVLDVIAVTGQQLPVITLVLEVIDVYTTGWVPIDIASLTHNVVPIVLPVNKQLLSDM
jgi:hypothetical protein